MNALPRALLVVTAFVVASCPGAQVKDGSGPADGKVEIVLRRVDVVEAGYDKMKLNVIIAVQNGTGDDVDVDAALDLALLGPAAADDDGKEEEAGAKEDEDGKVADEAAPAAEGMAAGLDGSRHAGRASGRAVAFNTSELPVTIELPLPSDPQVLEQVLTWKKARLHIKGKAKVGFSEQTLSGERDVATPILPELKLKSAQIAKMDDGAVGEAFITLLFDNKNPFAVTVDAVTWKISVKDKELRTKDDGSTSLPPSAVEEYNETVPLTDKDFPAKELKAMLKSPSVPYSVTAQFKVRGIVKDVAFKGEMQFPR